MGIVKPFIDLLEVTEKDVTIITSQMSNEKESLIRRENGKTRLIQDLMKLAMILTNLF